MNMVMKRPSIQPRSRLAHEAAKWAGCQSMFEQYNIALFRAFFEQGRNIGDIEVLKDLAAGLELDPVSLAQALQNGEFTSMVLADEGDAVQAGVRAVPAFVVNDKVLAAGVQTAERLHELLC